MTGFTRRQILVGASAVGVSAASNCIGVGTDTASGQFRSDADVLLDRRLPNSIGLAKAAQQLHRQVFLSNIDIGPIAMQLQNKWSEIPTPLIGYGLASSAFVIEQVAMRHGFRVLLPGNAMLQAGDEIGVMRSNLPLMSELRSFQRLAGRTPPNAVWWLAIPPRSFV